MAGEIINAVRRDGIEIRLGQRVSCYFPGCEDRVFIVCKITQHATCESGFMVLAHVEHEAQRILEGFQGIGLDTNWFTHADKTETPGRSGLHIEPMPGNEIAGRTGDDPGLDPPVQRNRERGGGRGVGRKPDKQLGLEL